MSNGLIATAAKGIVGFLTKNVKYDVHVETPHTNWGFSNYDRCANCKYKNYYNAMHDAHVMNQQRMIVDEPVRQQPFVRQPIYFEF